MGLTAYLESTLLELSNDVKFVERTHFSIVNLHINSPMHIGHMAVSNLLCFAELFAKLV